jgi:plasmid stability protein
MGAVKKKLRLRTAGHGRLMKKEAREILKAGVASGELVYDNARRIAVPARSYSSGKAPLATKVPAGARVSFDEALKLLLDSVQATDFVRRGHPGPKQAQKAIERLQEATPKRPRTGGPQLLLCRWMTDIGKTAEAGAALEAAQKTDPKSTAADRALAQFDLGQGSMEPSRQHVAVVLAAQTAGRRGTVIAR